MSITPVLEALEDSPEATATAHALIDALLTEAAALKKLDALMYPRHPDAAARKRSRQIFEAWHRWIADAEALLRQLETMKPTGPFLDRVREFQGELADAHSLTHMTLEKVERGREQALRRETVPGEEVRRELQLRVRGRRAG